MMSTKANGDALSEWFGECVVEEFKFLERNGFTCVDGRKDSFRFSSSMSTIEVYRDARSNEISLQIANPLGTQSFSISELVRLFEGKVAARSYRDHASHTREGVEEGVHKLAMKLQNFLNSPEWISCDLFEKLEASGKAWAHEYSLETKLEQVRKKLNIAWQSKDYQSVIELLSPFADHLSESELKKLAYAKSH